MIFIKYQDFLNESLNQKEFILLVGPPGMGKSFYTNKLEKKYDIFNRDDFATEISEKNGFTYKESFNRPTLVLNRSNKTYFVPEESNFYEEDGKTYLKNYEYLGEIIDLTEDSPYYLRRWTKNGFTKIIQLNIEIEDTFNNKLQESIKQRHDIIIDMTNFMKLSRKTIIDKLGDNKQYYTIKAVVFNEGGKGMEDTIIAINRKRDLELSKLNREKDIPDSVLTSFVKNYEEPEKEEGIDEIIHVDTKKELEYFLNLDKQT